MKSLYRSGQVGSDEMRLEQERKHQTESVA